MLALCEGVRPGAADVCSSEPVQGNDIQRHHTECLYVSKM